MSFIATLFCAMSMVICMRQPMPAPRTTMKMLAVSAVLSTSIVASSAEARGHQDGAEDRERPCSAPSG